MALDPNISLGVKPLQLADPLAQYGQMATIQNAQNQNALAQYQLGSAQRAEKTQNVLADAYAQSIDQNTGEIDYNKLTKLVGAGGGGALLPGIQKSRLEQQTARTTQQKSETELLDAKLKQSRGFLDTIDPAAPDAPARYLAWHEANHRDPIVGAALAARGVTADQSRAQIMAAIQKGPEAFAQLINQSKLGTEKFMEMNKPTLTPQNLGGTVRVLSSPGLGGTATPVVGSTATTTMTPFQAEDLKVKQGQLRIAQERLAAEAATGVLSPDSQELAANLYLTTGTLPPMGIGKGGAALKASIMNRAAEISKAGGATPAAGAANIIAAKQDVGTQTKALKDFSTGVQGQMVTSFNTAIDHLGTMDKLVDALNNGDIKAFNSLGNTVARQTGAPAPTNFDTARHIVGAEIQKAIIRAGGTGKEREEAANAFANAGSPAQLKGVIDTYKQLLGGQLNSLEMQYTANTGRKDFNKKLSPTAQETVRKLRGEGGVAPAGNGVDVGNPLLQTTP
jgi:hypothetical protein